MASAEYSNSRAGAWRPLWVLLCAASLHAHADNAAKYIAIDPEETEDHATGFVHSNPAEYRATKEVQQFRAFYPTSADLAAEWPAPGNQGKQGSCVAWAVGYAARTYYLKHDDAADISQAENIMSPAYIYNALRETKGDCSSGTSVSDALKLLKSSGGVPLNQLPYDPKECIALPPPAVLARYSDRFRIKGYRRVEGKNEDDIKGQIYSGNPVIFAIDIPAEFQRYHGGIIDSVVDRGYEYGHAMVIIGYDDSRQAYHFVNSWGTHWGENGFGWISYRSAAALWQEGFVMQVEPGTPAPTPPPPPAPSPTPGPTPNPAPAPIPAPRPPTPAPIPPAPLPPIHAMVPPQLDLTAACSSLRANASRTDRGFDFTLAGFAASTEDLDRIRAAALGRSGVTSVDVSHVSIRPWPQCEALLTLEDALRNPRGMYIAQNPNKSPLIRGDHMVFNVQSPDYPSYFYVAYLQADGSAAHLLRPNGAATTAPRTQFHLGDMPGTPRFKVGPPFGHEMVIALASDRPLQDEGLLGAIRERQLLTAYRRILRDPTAQRFSASILTVETAEQ
jgi:C1A family cysteine protease